MLPTYLELKQLYLTKTIHEIARQYHTDGSNISNLIKQYNLNKSILIQESITKNH